ncbi:MAG: YfcE family phosphodiesterase [Pirellulales bacterium]|nr:YfcE family phosphodiesterase [Pirellulales bacterium]
MYLAVVSDTHGHLANARAAALLLEPFAPASVLHCGDIGTPAIIDRFAQWEAHYVFGNTDGDLSGLRAAMAAAGSRCHDRFGELELAGRRIAFLHGDDERLLAATIAGGGYDLVCHGHTHQVRREQHGRTLVLNPGALYRARPHTIALVQLPELTVEVLRLESDVL